MIISEKGTRKKPRKRGVAIHSVSRLIGELKGVRYEEIVMHAETG